MSQYCKLNCSFRKARYQNKIELRHNMLTIGPIGPSVFPPPLHLSTLKIHCLTQRLSEATSVKDRSAGQARGQTVQNT